MNEIMQAYITRTLELADKAAYFKSLIDRDARCAEWLGCGRRMTFIDARYEEAARALGERLAEIDRAGLTDMYLRAAAAR